MTESNTLMQRIRAGDEEALLVYCERHRNQLSGFIRRNMSDGLRAKIEPEDILQETVVTACSTLSETQLGEREPFSWLCYLAERKIIDTHRRFAAQKRASEKEVALDKPASQDSSGGLIDLLVASMTSPSRAFSRDQKEQALWRALSQLPDEAQQALRLRYVENRPSKEIAANLGRSDGATRVLLTRSLKKLQATLQENELFESEIAPTKHPSDPDDEN